jgi:hypothetical protein
MFMIIKKNPNTMNEKHHSVTMYLPLSKLSPFGLQGYYFLFFLPNLVSINQCTIVNKFNYHSFSVPIYSNEQWYMLWIYSVLTDIVAVFFVGKTETVKYMYVLVCRRNILISKKYMDYFYYKNYFHGSFKLVGWVYVTALSTII